MQSNNVPVVIGCSTLFDITATGVRGTFRSAQIPFQDLAGNTITDLESWTKSRNQQRNWDTVNQIISLRCLPERIENPRRESSQSGISWVFQFEVLTPAAIARDHDPVGWLLADCQAVPMILGLDNDADLGAVLEPGAQGNINFYLLNDK